MFLIDGHNLIGQLEDLSLEDPQDEAKLTMAIKRYCMRGNFKATVIFDNGLPGGISRELSNSQVTVIFASSGTSADALLMRRARDIGNLNDVILVTSDRRITRLAYAYGMTTMASEEFALLIGFRPVEQEPETPAPNQPPLIQIIYEKDPNPVVSQQEIAYWLPIFKRRLEMARAERMAARLKGKNKNQDT